MFRNCGDRWKHEKNVIIFGVDNSPYNFTQGVDNSTITAEPKYPINFTESGKHKSAS